MIQFHLRSYPELGKDDLYQILRLRQRVFIEEQQSIYEDIDNLDAEASHLLAQDGDVLAGYTRLRWVDGGRTGKIERVVVASSHRGIKLGQQMMEQVMAAMATRPALESLTLSAQLEVVPFYQRWGFEPCSEPYDDGGILHRDMVLNIGSD